MKQIFHTLALAVLTSVLLASCDITPKDAYIPVFGVTLDRDTLVIRIGDPDVKLTATVLHDNAPDTTVSWASDDPDIATVDRDGVVKAVAAGRANVTVTTTEGNRTATCLVIIQGTIPEYVTIGGKQWAKMNLGATTVAGSYATCTGDYYQWGSVNKLYKSVTWNGTSATFSWRPGKEKGFVADNLEYTAEDGLTAANDVAQQYVGDGWRTPTMDDFTALTADCIKDYTPAPLFINIEANPSGESATVIKGVYWCTSYDGVAGVLFCNGRERLFFPAAGTGAGTSPEAGEKAAYWTNEPYFNGSGCCLSLFFGTSYSLKVIQIPNVSSRFNYGTIRPVKDI